MTRRLAIDMPCPICGLVFHRSPSAEPLTCSKACYTAYRAAHPLALRTFWKKVDKSDAGGCWPWTGWCDENGYGEVMVRRKKTGAHRVAYELATGDTLGERKCLHSCDNPPCCRPDHLRPGDHKMNAADSINRGRHSFGERHGIAKLTVSDVLTIRATVGCNTRKVQLVLAAKYGVTESTIYRVVMRNGWTLV